MKIWLYFQIFKNKKKKQIKAQFLKEKAHHPYWAKSIGLYKSRAQISPRPKAQPITRAKFDQNGNAKSSFRYYTQKLNKQTSLPLCKPRTREQKKNIIQNSRGQVKS